jgi:hypothetical protein
MEHVFLRPKERETPNLTATHGPKSFEGPTKREIRKLNCQLCTKNFLKAQVKRKIKKLNCQLWTQNFRRPK